MLLEYLSTLQNSTPRDCNDRSVVKFQRSRKLEKHKEAWFDDAQPSKHCRDLEITTVDTAELFAETFLSSSE
jgi:hypothetical protein